MTQAECIDALFDAVHSRPWFTSVGIAGERIILYVQRNHTEVRKVTKRFREHAIDVVVTGKVRPLASEAFGKRSAPMSESKDEPS